MKELLCNRHICIYYTYRYINKYIFIFSYIDQGRNPQLYTKDCIEKALTKNEQVKGKIDAYRKFKAHLLVELNSVFPNELTKYRAIRGDERPLT